MSNIRVFTHPHPINDSAIDATILVPVVEAVYSDHYDYEQVPASAIDRNLYRLQTSPLLVRDLNLDDIVMADDNGIFVELVKDSGKFGFRIGMEIHHEDHDELQKYDKVVEKLKELDCDIEFYSRQLVGVVAKNRWKARKVQKKLLRLVDEGLIIGVETNRA